MEKFQATVLSMNIINMYKFWIKMVGISSWQLYKACPSESGTDKFMQMFI